MSVSGKNCSSVLVSLPLSDYIYRSWGSSVSKMSDYRVDDRVRYPAEAKDFSSVSRPSLGSTQHICKGYRL
jgi:hypothetical protein